MRAHSNEMQVVPKMVPAASRIGLPLYNLSVRIKKVFLIHAREREGVKGLF